MMWTVLLFAVALPAQERRDSSGGQSDWEQTIIEGSGTEVPGMIGMEAFREVLVTGQYLVGPGDKFLMYIAEMEKPFEGMVLAEGGLFIPKVGPVQIGGMRLRDARAAIDSLYSATIRGGQIEVELSTPRKFPISVVGIVGRPGVVVASGVERVSELLQRAGGLSEGASTRNILLVRSGALSPQEMAILSRGMKSEIATGLSRRPGTRRVDLALYEATGSSALNPFVEDGDVVVVPFQQNVLQALEAVRRGGTYEFVEGDRLSDLLTLAMGVTSQYDPKNAYIFRYAQEGMRQVRVPVDIDGAMSLDPQANLPLESGDWLVVRSRPDYQEAATARIVGEVLYPGFYVVHREGTQLQQLLDDAGGVTEAASLVKARMVRRAEEHRERDPEFERILSIPPESWGEDERQYFNMRSREKPGQLVVDFVALAEGDSLQNILVRPGDLIVVPASQRTVLVSGQAAYPGAVMYHEDYDVWDYIARAGGYGWQASDDIRVIKARTGEIRDAESIQQIEPGDNIWIKEEPVRDYWSIFTESMMVAGQIATVLLVFVTVLK